MNNAVEQSISEIETFSLEKAQDIFVDFIKNEFEKHNFSFIIEDKIEPANFYYVTVNNIPMTLTPKKMYFSMSLIGENFPELLTKIKKMHHFFYISEVIEYFKENLLDYYINPKIKGLVKTGLFEHIKKFENWKESEKISDLNRKTGLISENNALSLLMSLKKYDISSEYNGEFNQLIEKEEEDGSYIKSSDIDRIIKLIQNS
jgi:predicted DNA-binding protein